jgi:hypothetical protein
MLEWCVVEKKHQCNTKQGASHKGLGSSFLEIEHVFFESK